MSDMPGWRDLASRKKSCIFMIFGGKSLFVCPQRSGQESRVFASSLSGRLVSWGLGWHRAMWWLSPDGSCIICHRLRQEVWTVLMFSDSLLRASHHNQHSPSSWFPLSCLLSFSPVPRFLVPCPLIMSSKQYNHKIQRLCQTDSHCIESLVGSSKIPEPYLFLPTF